MLPFVEREKPKHLRRRIRTLRVGIRSGRIAPEPSMARAVHQPLLGKDKTLGVLQHRPGIGIPTGNDAPLDLLVVCTVRLGVACAVIETCHRLRNHNVAVVRTHHNVTIAMKNDRRYDCAKSLGCGVGVCHGNAATSFHCRERGGNVVSASIAGNASPGHCRPDELNHLLCVEVRHVS